MLYDISDADNKVDVEVSRTPVTTNVLQRDELVKSTEFRIIKQDPLLSSVNTNDTAECIQITPCSSKRVQVIGPRIPWSCEEKRCLVSYFKDNLISRRQPTKQQCEKCIEINNCFHPTRTWKRIQYYTKFLIFKTKKCIQSKEYYNVCVVYMTSWYLFVWAIT